MPQIASLRKSRQEGSPTGSIPVGVSGSSVLLSQAFHASIDRLPYRVFSRSPYQNFLYSPEPLEALLPALTKIYNLLTLPNNWNSYGGCAPSYDAVEYAHRWLLSLYREVTGSGQKWCDPAITASGDGEVVFEWWKDSKKLTIYIGNQSAEYVKVWGPDINTDMEDGPADSPDMRDSLWKWLMS
jgi:hypothetical protein